MTDSESSNAIVNTSVIDQTNHHVQVPSVTTEFNGDKSELENETKLSNVSTKIVYDALTVVHDELQTSLNNGSELLTQLKNDVQDIADEILDFQKTSDAQKSPVSDNDSALNSGSISNSPSPSEEHGNESASPVIHSSTEDINNDGANGLLDANYSETINDKLQNVENNKTTNSETVEAPIAEVASTQNLVAESDVKNHSFADASTKSLYSMNLDESERNDANAGYEMQSDSALNISNNKNKDCDSETNLFVVEPASMTANDEANDHVDDKRSESVATDDTVPDHDEVAELSEKLAETVVISQQNVESFLPQEVNDQSIKEKDEPKVGRSESPEKVKLPEEQALEQVISENEKSTDVPSVVVAENVVADELTEKLATCVVETAQVELPSEAVNVQNESTAQSQSTDLSPTVEPIVTDADNVEKAIVNNQDDNNTDTLITVEPTTEPSVDLTNESKITVEQAAPVNDAASVKAVVENVGVTISHQTSEEPRPDTSSSSLPVESLDESKSPDSAARKKRYFESFRRSGCIII